MSKRKQYSEEFKREAIRLQVVKPSPKSSGKSIAEIERELGLSHNLLRQWKQRFQINEVTNSLELNDGNSSNWN